LKLKNPILFLLVIGGIFASMTQELLAYSESKKIQSGDVIEILVYGQGDLSRVVKVSVDGTINFPFLSDLPVDGLTLNELRDIISVQLSKYVERKPIVTLNFLSTYLISVTVLGQVLKPGTYQIPQNASIQGAIGQAGSFIPGAKLKELQLIRQLDSEKQTIPVDLEKFIIEADLSLLPNLEDGDVIFVPGWPGATAVKIAGEVKIPGNYEVFANFQNILDIIFKAGGATDDADLTKVVLISFHEQQQKEEEINIQKCLEQKKYDAIPKVVPGDVIFVPAKKEIWKQFVQVMRDLTSFATLYIIFRYGRRL
jgi:protein involved in polysaccharide export with SLBB domain